MTAPRRRQLLRAAAAGGTLASLALLGCASVSSARPRVLVVGGGYGGATAAKYLRQLSAQHIDVVLVEPDPAFVSCPLSNLVLGGSRTLAELTVPYAALAQAHGVTVLRDTVAGIDPTRRSATLASGTRIAYDRLVLSPGIELIWDSVEGLQQANADGRVLQAWKAGPETAWLRRQLEAMPDGGVFAIAIPELPYRCPPGPYERACQVASYFKAAKPRAKVLVLDANDDVAIQGALFKRAWAELYPGMVEYRPQHKAVAVDARGGTSSGTPGGTLKFEFQDDLRADVLNVLPAMRAGAIAVQTGLANVNARWCGVGFLDFQSTAAPYIHVIGDSVQSAPQMAKSGHMANGHGKVAAAAIVAELGGREVDPAPQLQNSCYSFVDARRAMHQSSVHAYVAAEQTFRVVAGAGSASAAPSEADGAEAWNWARAIWSDALA